MKVELFSVVLCEQGEESGVEIQFNGEFLGELVGNPQEILDEINLDELRDAIKGVADIITNKMESEAKSNG